MLDSFGTIMSDRVQYHQSSSCSHKAFHYRTIYEECLNKNFTSLKKNQFAHTRAVAQNKTKRCT